MSYFRVLLYVFLCKFFFSFFLHWSVHTKKLLDIKVNLNTKFGKYFFEVKIVYFLELAVLGSYFDSHSEGCLSDTPSFNLLGRNAMQQAFI